MKIIDKDRIIETAKQSQLSTGDIWDSSRGSKVIRTGGILGLWGNTYTVYMYKNGAGGNLLVTLNRKDLSLVKIKVLPL